MSKLKQGHHNWMGDRCTRCGVLIYKVHSIVWGCTKSRVKKRSLKRKRKELPE